MRSCWQSKMQSVWNSRMLRCFSIKTDVCKMTIVRRILHIYYNAMPRVNENAQQVLLHPRSFSHIWCGEILYKTQTQRCAHCMKCTQVPAATEWSLVARRYVSVPRGIHPPCCWSIWGTKVLLPNHMVAVVFTASTDSPVDREHSVGERSEASYAHIYTRRHAIKLSQALTCQTFQISQC